MRNLGRTVVFLGVAGILLSMGWWAFYYSEIIRALGAKPALTNPLNCLLWTADICNQPQAAAKLQNFPAYTPLAMWASLVVLLVGMFVVYRTTCPEPYPVTPPGEAKPVIGKLEPFYAWVRDLSWPLIRVAVGGTLLTHGLNKVMNVDVMAFAKGLAARGLEPSVPFAYLIFFLETGGAVMIMLGLLTRIVAPMLAIEFFIITFVAHFANGYGWSSPRGGWEFPLMWGVIFLAIALRGGGPYSLDRLLRREL